MLEFNPEHKKADVNEATKKLSLNKKIIIGGAVIFISVSAALIGAGVAELHSPSRMAQQQIHHDMQTTIEKTLTEKDSDILLTAEKVDYYNTINDTFDSMSDPDAFYTELEKRLEHSDSDDSIPSYEEFKESVERTILNIEYMRHMIYYDLTEEEINGFYSQMYSDYNVITNYLEKNEQLDYDKLFDESLESKIRDSFKKQDIGTVYFNDIHFVKKIDEKTNKEKEYAVLNVNVNGENMQFETGSRLYSILADRYNSKITVHQINELLNSNYDFNMNNGSISDSKENLEKKVLIGLRLLCCLIVMSPTIEKICREKKERHQKH